MTAECLHDLFGEAVARWPDTPALVTAGVTLTYRELDERANGLAHRLRDLGVGPESLVGLCLPRGPEVVVAILGVLKTGAGYVPLDPDHPAERLTHCLRNSAAEVVITDSAVRDGLPPIDSHVICCDRDPDVLSGRTHAPERRGDTDNVAYVIFTSGSTGRPKGVAVPHRGVVNLVPQLRDVLGYGPGARVLQCVSFGFDVSVVDVFCVLSAGGTLYVAGTADLATPQSLGRLLRQSAITAVSLPPSMLALVPDQAYPHLRTVFVAGEACSVDITRRFAGLRLVNGYGPTEGSVIATTYTVDPLAELAAVPIGMPVRGCPAYVLDVDGNLAPCAPGETGEIHLAGTGVTRGYVGSPGATAERFLPDPFSPGGRMYRTGDLGRVLPDGNLEYLGRTDHQVKVRGLRIELNEIERALEVSPNVRQAIVTVRQDMVHGAELIAFYIPAGRVRGEEQELSGRLRDHLATTLPRYMIPNLIVPLTEFPLTPNGKVDRAALAALELGVHRTHGERLAPRTPYEQAVAAAWREVLGVDVVSLHDDFFELGGNSLLATRVLARLRTALGVDAELRTVLDARTLEALAASLTQLSAGHGTAAPTIRPRRASTRASSGPGQ
ncbi:non-ribosomal peptide synthetase [Streptomyces sp. NPDC006430]|uniref:non-ribosomal peptide synthetase n=1 Tax=Streptomyces sp. NPDC006430 TaxID=3154299 RepID=UPI0033B6F5F1